MTHHRRLLLCVGSVAVTCISLVGCVDSGASSAYQDSLPAESKLFLSSAVGLVGCSMSVDAAEGYRRVGGQLLWRPVGLGYGGGSVKRWSEPDDKRGLWRGFEEGIARQPDTELIWWQLCTSGSPEDDFTHASIVLEEIDSRLAGAVVYVSAQPRYADGHVCPSAGVDGPQRMDDLAQVLLKRSAVKKGPILSALRPNQLADRCHANEAGKEQMGHDLMSFFGGSTQNEHADR